MIKGFLSPIGLVLLCASNADAQSRQRSNLEPATVFLSGAELYSTAKLSRPSGETEVLLTAIAGNVNAQTLALTATNNVVVQSATF